MKRSGSLALRVLVVCTALLIIPLCVHTWILYRQEWDIKIQQLCTELKVFAREQEQFLEEVIHSRQDELDLIALGLQAKTQEEASSFIASCQDLLAPAALTRVQSIFGKNSPSLDAGQVVFTKRSGKDTLILTVATKSLLKTMTSSVPFQLALMDNITPDVADFDTYSLSEIEEELKRSETQRELIGLKMPIRGSSISLVIAIPKRALLHLEKRHLVSRLFSLFFLSLLIGGAGAFWLTRRMARPLKHLCTVMEEISQGKVSARFKEDPMGFEINLLGHNFNQMIDALFKTTQEMKRERLEKELLAAELKIGHEIQKSILPKQFPHIPDVEIASGFIPAKEVAGDFYDVYFKEEDNCVMIAIADAAGKGTSACLYSLGVRSMLRSLFAAQGNLAETIRLTNHLFCQDSGETSTFVTVWIAVLDLRTKELQFCACGHPPALLKRKTGALEELTTSNPALGVLPLREVHLSSVTLMPGDCLVLYTDGVIEAHDAALQRFGKERFYALIEAAKDKSAQDMVDYYMQSVAAFEGGASQFDDLTLLVMKIL